MAQDCDSAVTQSSISRGFPYKSLVPVPGSHAPIWSQLYGGFEEDDCNDVIALSGGGYALIGYTDISPAPYTDIYILGTDGNGNQLWSNTFGGVYDDKGISGAECSTGGLIISGYIQDTMSYSESDIILIRTSNTGTHLWNKTFGGVNEEKVGAVIECSGGGFILVGDTTSFGAGSCDVWLIRTDASGNLLWDVTFGGYYEDRGYDIVECSDGGFAVLGYTYSSSTRSYDLWLIRTDASGNLLWSKTYGSDRFETSRGLVECAGGGFAITGTKYTASSSGDIWLLRTDATGNLLWDEFYGGSDWENSDDLIECSDGGFAITGETRSYGSGGLDLWVIRTNNLGECLWTKSYGGVSSDYSGGIVEVGAGGFVVAGGYTTLSTSDRDVWLLHIPDPFMWWGETTGDKIVEVGAGIWFELVAKARLGIDRWWINDTVKFNLSAGVITNASVLSLGNHGVQVWVNDSVDNRLNKNITFTVEPQAPPTWVEVPTNQVVELGTPFIYNLNATDRTGIDAWWLTNTIPFRINEEGIISNDTFLALGEYDLQIWVNDTFGNTISASFQVQVVDQTAPVWVETPQDLYCELGYPFYCDLDAKDLSGIDTWSIDDTTRFTISPLGTITNITFLPVGDYPIFVWVNDTLGNTLNAYFKVTVNDNVGPIFLNTQPALIGTPDLFVYQLEAYDLSGVGGWGVSDTTNFDITESGLLSNRRTLNPGTYNLTVYVYDIHGNSKSKLIQITITGLGSMMFTIIIMAALVIVLVVGGTYAATRRF